MEFRDAQWIIDNYRTGSYEEPWTWEDEERDLECRSELTIPFGERPEDAEPVTLGDDGRVWNGHHRILMARKTGTLVPIDWGITDGSN